MSVSRLSAQLWCEILFLCPHSTTIVFALICRNFRAFADRILYRKVRLSYHRALLFFRTLHGQPALGKHVRLLHLHRAESVRHEGPEFEAALSCMKQLHSLHIMCPIDVKALVNCLRTPLRTFTYGLPSCDTFHRFLVQQPYITSICLHHRLNREPSSWFLPMLEKVEALSEDLADLIVGAPVRRLKFRYQPAERVTQPVVPPIFFHLSAVPIVHVECMACQLVDHDQLDIYLPHLETLVVSQDITWGDRLESNAYSRLANDLAGKLTRLPNLVLFIVVTDLGSPQAHRFCQALRRHCRAPRLGEFVFHTHNKCFRWSDFRLVDSTPTERLLIDCISHCAADLV
ncbi:hypothetical protein MSAN_02035900 [Mycena sanguinolenta]|uniref:F-box domain-containing protein n=1 Tax=Mycena sanguinolenta TaxID=230812 RepID=A0A8H6XK53_9AGAR|nr:hypothetical protein MSAN_02035900 [Mycena sanguinolenta]